MQTTQSFDNSCDSRFPTRNTNLAACLAALRVPIKTQDPVWVVEEGEGDGPKQQVVTYFFDEQSAPNNDGYPVEKSAHIEWAWRNREKFERENLGHALIWMRLAIDKLEWLIKVKYGQIKPSPRPKIDGLKKVTDITLAACIMGLGYELHSYCGGPANRGVGCARDTRAITENVFKFDIPTEEYDRIIEEFECYRHGKDPICYMRKALECRKLLIATAKKAPVLLHFHNGDPFAGGKEGYIARDCERKKIERFLELLYE